jgi:hypothetical protein
MNSLPHKAALDLIVTWGVLIVALLPFPPRRRWPKNARLSWNRIVTDYDRDTDVILGEIGYRF